MKFGAVVMIDTETGDYELRFNNVSKPGEGMDYYLVLAALTKVVEDWKRQVDASGPDSTEFIKKDIH